jgi:hypothetical protein
VTEEWTVRRRGLRGILGVRFARFAGAAVAALTATEITLTICNGVFHLTATPAALASWFAGAVVSYALSRPRWPARCAWARWFCFDFGISWRDPGADLVPGIQPGRPFE